MKGMIIVSAFLIISGCVGDSIHRTLTYQARQRAIERNNQNLLMLKINMTTEQVLTHMGPPERSEGYPWGLAWLYRTAMTSGIYGTEDTDFTPLVFDQTGRLVGWGRNFFKEHARRYQIEIK